MHLTLILLAIVISGLTRFLWWRSAEWSDRWQRTLIAFLLPPLLLLTTAVAVMCMGTQGQMLGLPAGWIGYLLALSFLATAIGLLLRLGWQGWRSLRHVHSYPVQSYPVLGQDIAIGHVVATSHLFAAQIGFWNSQLVVSQGLLDRLTPEQLEAVLTHERAHAYYRDTFWFFWMGWLRHFTVWLPNTEALWQELLLLRELRADRWAAQAIDPLLLAESLLLTVKETPLSAADFCAAFSAAAPLNRLEERIDALLLPSESAELDNRISLLGLWVALVPLLTVLFHQ
ncbi:MAG: M56 family metallopeptidase [Drouetiella hepatica Uher 2000/2452]|jgi:Zn-dependent protease with chaperone function|uniref:M56 family metallopeptidase n=1 Tax=Drouetiella hepatica Uher 2000/2452 TaxID=904376 RepID=A0A951Q9W1_9CYAN|nr:M56 family metallopeptidase [Drouetiella hepatica Uher 2000/2452]